ncbi:MAG TPA: 50S ribosomal protein L19 [Phycisphaerae bacterium]|nr:50S ribosomal protein L19 [Phycisphaerae bacterium]HRR86305.1 50S ribosomal protein L19 [Phycisphaerae bacterium]
MINALIEKVESAAKKKQLPKFSIGDTVSVQVRIVEGGKERIQPFIGVVIGRRGRGMGESFTVRRIVNNEGVERIFPLHSPKVAGVEIIRSGHIRRAKLYYLRDRVGKARRLRDRKRDARQAVDAAVQQ